MSMTNTIAEIKQELDVYAAAICRRTKMKKVIFGNSGAEANEYAVLVARKYASDKYGDDSHSTIIALKNCAYQPAGCVYAEANNIADVRRLTEEHGCCAIMVEIIQGDGTMLNYGFVKGLRMLCDEKDLLFIADETQTGSGRTGRLCAYQNFERPVDIFTSSDGPRIGACVIGEKAQHTLDIDGNVSDLLACFGASMNFNLLSNKMLLEIRNKGAYIMEKLNGTRGIKSISGMGLILSIETERSAAEIADACLKRGVSVQTANASIRLLFSYDVKYDELDSLLAVLTEEIERI